MKIRNPFSGKTKDVSEIVPEKSKNMQSIPKLNVNYVVETMKLINALMKEGLVWE